MAEFPTYEEMAKEVAEKALDEFTYNGKTIREWVELMVTAESVVKVRMVEEFEKIKADFVEQRKDFGFVVSESSCLKASRIFLSVAVSTALVLSSRIIIFGFFKSARAIQTRCF